ncbi:alcohol dehydrogenase class-3 chain L-like [Centruroides vittatus]|uniref:alcohol dehydrogenase class-3 chain L-like n=1 Tax=Centruroides vittatus TaxID=120091 RepID=UPI0035106DC7
MFSTQGKPIKCKAAVAWSKGEPLSIEIVEVAPPENTEVRIKVISTGVCNTDASFLQGFDPNQRFPLVLGHEAAGIVESVGKNVKYFKPGDHVIPLFLPQCQQCDLCKNPDTNLCEKVVNESGRMENDPKSLSCKGKLLSQLMNLGTFSEFTVVEEMQLTKINPKAPLDKMALLGCCIPTGYGAAVYCAKVRKGSICAIWGLGGVGMSVVMGCHYQGAKQIIGVDINVDKFKLAKKLGCTNCINPKDHDKPIEKVLTEMTGGKGVDYAFIAVGIKDAVKSALLSTRMGIGKVIVIGLIHGGEVCVDALGLLMGRTVMGTNFGNTRGLTDVPKMVDDYMNGKLPSDDLITNVINLDDINTGFELMRTGKSLKTVVILKHQS